MPIIDLLLKMISESMISAPDDPRGIGLRVKGIVYGVLRRT